MKNKGLTAFILVSALTLATLIPASLVAEAADRNTETVQETQNEHCHSRHGGGKKGEKTAEPENAIGKDAAKEKALSDAGVTAEQAGKVRIHVSQLDDSTVVYQVRFSFDGQRYSYQIHAVSGVVLDKNAEAVTEETAADSSRHDRHGGGKKGEKTAEPENAIGKDAAKEKALSDAGVTAEQVGKVRIHVSQLDDGTVVYQVRFSFDGQRYSYQIHAVSGVVLDKSAEAVTEVDASKGTYRTA